MMGFPFFPPTKTSHGSKSLSLVTFYNVKLESSLRAFRVLQLCSTRYNCTSPPNSVVRGPAPETQSKELRGWRAPSLARAPAQSIKREIKAEKEEVELPPLPSKMSTAAAHQLSEYNEGHVETDVQLRPLSNEKERQLFFECKDGSLKYKPARYAVLLFRNLVPYENYCGWIGRVNYVGLQGRDALPVNLRRTIRALLEFRFRNLRRVDWNRIRRAVNAVLRVKKKKTFFCET